MCAAGYSSNPLSKKLGIIDGFVIRVFNAPVNYMDLFDDFPDHVSLTTDDKIKKNLIHYFVTEQKKLIKDMYVLKNALEQNGCIWISWPKKSSGVVTDIIRNIAIQNGFVDIKVCAINEIWSGLKLVIPVKNRN